MSLGKGLAQIHSEIITPLIDAGFIIEKLSEPMPAQQLLVQNPEIYHRLSTRPQFLFVVRAMKS